MQNRCCTSCAVDANLSSCLAVTQQHPMLQQRSVWQQGTQARAQLLTNFNIPASIPQDTFIAWCPRAGWAGTDTVIVWAAIDTSHIGV